MYIYIYIYIYAYLSIMYIYIYIYIFIVASGVYGTDHGLHEVHGEHSKLEGLR